MPCLLVRTYFNVSKAYIAGMKSRWSRLFALIIYVVAVLFQSKKNLLFSMCRNAAKKNVAKSF